jgi:peptidoglycan/LPS O-acetylase OafA/YrhL
VSVKSRLALSAGLILGFLALALVFSVFDGRHDEVLGALACACGVSVFVLWAMAGARR